MVTESVLRIVTVSFSVPVPPTLRPESVCERWRTSLIEHYGGKPEPQQYLPQCEPDGQFRYTPHYPYTAKHSSWLLVFLTNLLWFVTQPSPVLRRDLLLLVCWPGWSRDCWNPIVRRRQTCLWGSFWRERACPCVQNIQSLFLLRLFRHVPGLPSVAPPTVRPLPRPDVTPPPQADVTLLYAQGQKIGALPLNGTRLDETRARTMLTLHVRNSPTVMQGWIFVILTFGFYDTCPGFHRSWLSLRLQREPCLLDRSVCTNNQQSSNGTWSGAWNTH